MEWPVSSDLQSAGTCENGGCDARNAKLTETLSFAFQPLSGVVFAPCVHILWKSGRSVTVIPRHDAESRRHPDGTHCTAIGTRNPGEKTKDATLWLFSGFRFSAE